MHAMRFARSAPLLLAASLLAAPVSAQSASGGDPVLRTAPPGSQVRSTGIPQRDTLMLLMRPLTVTLEGQRLEDVLAFIQNSTGAPMEIMWIDDQHSDGLDKDAQISLRATNLPALTLLERVLQKADAASGNARGSAASQWQMADSGEIQVGPRARLNAFRRIELYDIYDLLLTTPNYTDAPEFDLQSVLQSNEGGGGQSPFSQTQRQTNPDIRTNQEKADEVVGLITRLVEPEQWETAGGDGATIEYFQQQLVINAPDYIHRQLNGYAYWPSRSASAGGLGQRRWVQFGGSFEASELEGFGTQPVFVPPR